MKESVKLNRISLTYQTPETEIKALENVSFTVHEGEFVSVIGPSGCGKTSVLSIIAGLIKPSSGELIFGGNSKTSDSSIGYMLQKDELFPWRTIEGNAYLPLEIKRDKDEKHRKIVEKLLKNIIYGNSENLTRMNFQVVCGSAPRSSEHSRLRPNFYF